jgi:hypothetical protein
VGGGGTGKTPPPAMVALIKVSNSSSPRMASCKCLGVIRLTFKSFAALPASSRTSAVRYSRMAAQYTLDLAPTRMLHSQPPRTKEKQRRRSCGKLLRGGGVLVLGAHFHETTNSTDGELRRQDGIDDLMDVGKGRGYLEARSCRVAHLCSAISRSTALAARLATVRLAFSARHLRSRQHCAPQ